MIDGLPVCNVFPPVIQIVAHAAEFLTRWVCMVAEINQSLKNLCAAIAFFLVTDEQALSYCIYPPLERRVCRGTRDAASKSRYEVFAKVLNLELEMSYCNVFCLMDGVSDCFWRTILPHI